MVLALSLGGFYARFPPLIPVLKDEKSREAFLDEVPSLPRSFRHCVLLHSFSLFVLTFLETLGGRLHSNWRKMTHHQSCIQPIVSVQCVCFIAVCHSFKSYFIPSPSFNAGFPEVEPSPSSLLHVGHNRVSPRCTSPTVHLPSVLRLPRSSFPLLSVVLWDVDKRFFSARVVPSLLGLLFPAFSFENSFWLPFSAMPLLFSGHLS